MGSTMSPALLAVALALPWSAVAPLPPGRHPHEVGQLDSLGVIQDADTGAHSPYSDIIPATVEHCYHRLVKDPSCCVDERFAPDVEKRTFDRPGTSWICDANCSDTPRGLRGRDTMWVPRGATCSSPRILWIHGGSWWYGSPDTLGYGQLGSKLAALTGAVVLVPDYPLIPAGNYSVILSKSVEAAQWLMEHGPAECGDVEAPVFVGGDSSGGGTAFSLVLELGRRPELLKGRALAGALLWSPWTNLMCNTPEYYHHAFAQIPDPKRPQHTAYVGDIVFQGRADQNRKWFKENAESYVGSDSSLLRDPIASPFFAGEEELGRGNVPPLYFAVGGSESILGDSVVVGQKAAAFGVDVQLDVYTGMWHVFPMYSEGCGGGEELWEAKRALERTAAFVRRVAAPQGPLAMVPNGLFASPEMASDPGASVPKPPFTVLNYELEEGLLPQVAAPVSLPARGPADSSLQQEAAAPTSLAERRQVGSSRWPQDSAHAATFLLGAGSVLAAQALARRLAGGRKELADNSVAAPLLA